MIRHSTKRLRAALGAALVAGCATTLLTPTPGIAQTVPDGSIDTTFTSPALDGLLYSLVVQGDGKILVGGNFTGRVKRLNADGSIDKGFASLNGSSTSTIAVQPDGKFLIGLNGGTSSSGGLKRLNADGSDDITFNQNAAYHVASVPLRIVVQPDGKILLGFVNGRFYRLLTDGTIDSGFAQRNFGNNVREIVVQTDGTILVGGSFTGKVKRLTANGYDMSAAVFSTPSSITTLSTVDTIAVQSDGKILVGGGYTVRRLERNGSVDATFTPPVLDGNVFSIVVQSDDKVLLGGAFTGSIKRLLPGGAPDSTFQSPTLAGPQPWLLGIVVQPDGKILIGGYFAGGIKRLNNALPGSTVGGTILGGGGSNITVWIIVIAAAGLLLVAGGTAAVRRRKPAAQ